MPRCASTLLRSSAVLGLLPLAACTTPAIEEVSTTALAGPKSVLTDVVVTLSNKGVDEESVHADTIWLLEGDSVREVPAEVVWDPDSRTITLTPLLPLHWATTYWVHIDGVRAKRGGEIPAVVGSFDTWVNPSTGWDAYDPATGDVTHRTDLIIDDWGQTTLSLSRSAGPDQTWDTLDDTLSSYSSFHTEGDETTTRSYHNPGVDEAWQTADDVLGYLAVATSGPAGVLQHLSYAPGLDERYGTADDTVASGSFYTYDEAHRQVRWVAMANPGPDGLAQTADDDLTGYHDTTYSGELGVDTVSYGSAGADGLWLTDDDRVSWHSVHTVDLATGIRVTETFGEAGTDGQWFTDDDVITGLYVQPLDGNGQPEAEIWYDHPGDDGQWHTADDEVNGYNTLTYDGEGNRIEMLGHATAGANDTWLDEDDGLDHRESFLTDL